MSFGRNGEFLVAPDAKARRGRHVVPKTGPRIPMFAPVEYDLSVGPDALGRQPVVLAVNGGTHDRDSGLNGIMIHEFIQYVGVDPVLTSWSDLDAAPLGAAVQVIADPDVKVLFRNTLDRTFLGSRPYPGRVMVAGLGATPTIFAGDYLAPGVGNDTDGYWAQVSDVADAWFVITKITPERGEVEARMIIH